MKIFSFIYFYKYKQPIIIHFKRKPTNPGYMSKIHDNFQKTDNYNICMGKKGEIREINKIKDDVATPLKGHIQWPLMTALAFTPK